MDEGVDAAPPVVVPRQFGGLRRPRDGRHPLREGIQLVENGVVVVRTPVDDGLELGMNRASPAPAGPRARRILQGHESSWVEPFQHPAHVRLGSTGRTSGNASHPGHRSSVIEGLLYEHMFV
jgi:hypothetical protein